MKVSKVFTTKLASEEALTMVLSYTAIAPVKLEGFSGLGLEGCTGDLYQRVGWWKEGMSLLESISPEFREEVLPEDPAFYKLMNTPFINDGETFTFRSVVSEVVGGVSITYNRLFNSSRLVHDEPNAGLVFPHKSRGEIASENEAARRTAYYEERGEVLL